MNERFEQLVRGIVGPLVLGGKLTLLRPFGLSALTVGQNERVLDPDLRTNLDVARVRRARLLAPIDVLPELTETDWAIAAVLNDVLQVTNHHLGGTFTMSRYGDLIRSIFNVSARIPAPRNIGDALARHATFARVLELSRTDTTVAWWTGSARFRGEEPPARLLVWRDVRRVRVDHERVSLTHMANDIAPVNDYLHALNCWMQLSPLTDLGTLTRDAPAFVWSPATIALIAVPAGRTLVYRALMRTTTDLVVTALNRARTTVPPELSAHQPLIDEFSAEVGKSLERPGASKSA
jgi:hypothetical protein